MADSLKKLFCWDYYFFFPNTLFLDLLEQINVRLFDTQKAGGGLSVFRLFL
jgi:hypothetical protein